MDDVVAKPIEIRHLIAAIEAALDQEADAEGVAGTAAA